MIAADCQEFVNLVTAMSHFGMPPEAALGQLPVFAWFAGESHRALTRHLGVAATAEFGSDLFAQYKDSVTKVRARLKLFDDNRGGLDALLDTFELARLNTHAWFNKDHHGALGWLKRRFQPDLGIYWVDSRPALTTHTAVLTMGLTRERLEQMDPELLLETMREFGREFSEAIGVYVGQLAAVFDATGMLTWPDLDDLAPVDVQFTHSDHYSERAYWQIQQAFGFPEPELAVAALFVATQVNYSRDVLPRMFRPDGFLLLRARFLCACHATTALRKLAESADESLPAGRILIGAARSKASELFVLMRQERNLLAHYGIRGRAGGAEAGGNALEWAVRQSSGLSLGELAAIVGTQLNLLSQVFDGVADKRTMRASRAVLGDNT